MEADQNQIQQEKIERARREVEEHNSKLLPETPGYVRTEGPRRQYEGYVDSSGTKHWVEI